MFMGATDPLEIRQKALAAVDRDESRLGLKPIYRRRITAHGVPPIAIQQ